MGPKIQEKNVSLDYFFISKAILILTRKRVMKND